MISTNKIGEERDKYNIFYDVIKILPSTKQDQGLEIINILRNHYDIDRRGYFRNNNVYSGDLLKSLLTNARGTPAVSKFIQDVIPLLPHELNLKKKLTPPIKHSFIPNIKSPNQKIKIADIIPSKKPTFDSTVTGGRYKNRKNRWVYL